ncbi:hypothetical protein RFI_07243, partial [Reticulomyxa filosa]
SSSSIARFGYFSKSNEKTPRHDTSVGQTSASRKKRAPIKITYGHNGSKSEHRRNVKKSHDFASTDMPLQHDPANDQSLFISNSHNDNADNSVDATYGHGYVHSDDRLYRKEANAMLLLPPAVEKARENMATVGNDDNFNIINTNNNNKSNNNNNNNNNNNLEFDNDLSWVNSITFNDDNDYPKQSEPQQASSLPSMSGPTSFYDDFAFDVETDTIVNIPKTTNSNSQLSNSTSHKNASDNPRSVNELGEFEWSCPQCTLKNHKSVNQCSLCDTPKPLLSRAVLD